MPYPAANGKASLPSLQIITFFVTLVCKSIYNFQTTVQIAIKNKEKSNPEMSVKSNGEETGQVIKAKDLLSDDEGKND